MGAYAAFMALVERNLVPDVVLRAGIRRNLRTKCVETFDDVEDELEREQAFIEDLRARSVIAIETTAANEQHYEVPTAFYDLCLGTRKKYSCCLYEDLRRTTLDEAETAMLETYAKRAELEDGMSILELGCGWGSLSLFLAEKYPKSRVVGVSNSRTQKEYIDARANALGLKNLQIITKDVNEFEPPNAGTYDRIMSIEMFEHMKNYDTLFARCETWLKAGGKMFVHIFCHKYYPFHYDVQDETDWMSKYFFTGGTMPTDRMFAYFARKLHLKRQWRVNGKHYSRTCEDWLKLLDENYKKGLVAPILDETYGRENRIKWYVYWRLFFLSCSELFNYNNGNEWYISHYLFEKLA